MASGPSPVARIRVARSLPRMLALPALGLIAGGAAIAAGILLGLVAPGLALAAAGSILLVLAVATAAVLLSIRVEIEDAGVRVRRLGGRRDYELVPGPVTRVRLRGPAASRLRPRNRLPGWQLGRARLRDDEDVDVIRLAPTPTAIIVPTDRGRLVIAAQDEAALLEALSSAARARRRRETPATAVTTPAGTEASPAPPAPPPSPPSPMTGIERARHEAREAAEREAAMAAERAAAELAAAEAARPAEAESQGQAAVSPRPATWVGRRALALGRPRPSAALVLLPLVGAGAALGTGLILDSLPELETELGRLTAVALVLAGPVATLGAIMARVWWPRLVGVVVAGALAASVFVGRSLIGG